jgi:hypothetical protein
MLPLVPARVASTWAERPRTPVARRLAVPRKAGVAASPAAREKALQVAGRADKPLGARAEKAENPAAEPRATAVDPEKALWEAPTTVSPEGFDRASDRIIGSGVVPSCANSL